MTFSIKLARYKKIIIFLYFFSLDVPSTVAVLVSFCLSFLLPVLLLTVLYSKIFREVSWDHVQG
jgi:hypothetical protein